MALGLPTATLYGDPDHGTYRVLEAVGTAGNRPCPSRSGWTGHRGVPGELSHTRAPTPMSFWHPAGLCGVDAETPNALVLTGRINRADVPGLCARLEALLSSGAPEVTAVDCDVSGVVHPDLALIEAVARLGLVARRAGGVELRLRNVPPGARALLELTGLADVIGPVGTAPGQERDAV